MHNMCKIWFANNIFSLLRLNKKYFSWFFQGLSVARNCLGPETAPLAILAIKKELLCNSTKNFKTAILWDIKVWHPNTL